MIALLLAAVIVGDFGALDHATLWRSASDEAACSREIADLGHKDARCRQASLAELPEGSSVDLVADTRGLCTSRRVRLVRVRATLAPNVTAPGCLFSGSVR